MLFSHSVSSASMSSACGFVVALGMVLRLLDRFCFSLKSQVYYTLLPREPGQIHDKNPMMPLLQSLDEVASRLCRRFGCSLVYRRVSPGGPARGASSKADRAVRHPRTHP